MMKIYISGDGIEAYTHESESIDYARVVGIIDLGANNGDNIYGWSGIKGVVNFNNGIYIIDFPENCKITTDDDLFIYKSEEYWHPSLENAEKFDLFIYPESCRNGFV